MTREEIIDIVGLCRAPGMYIRVHQDPSSTMPPRMYLQVGGTCADARDPRKEIKWAGRKWFLSQHMTRSEIVQTAFKAVITAMEHEVREGFTFRGEPIYGPHWDVELLAEMLALRGQNVLDVRTGGELGQ
jgi:hypothetical protein